MTEDAHAGTECEGCEWERQPQAFRWFPEMGRPLDPAPAAAVLRVTSGHVAMSTAGFDR